MRGSKLKKNIFIKSLFKFNRDHGFEHSGYIAFLTLFAIIPIFMIILAAMSLIYETNAGVEIIKIIINFLPDYALSVIQPQIHEIFSTPSTHFISFVFLGSLWTTSSSLEGMRVIFNKIYRVHNPPFFLLTRLSSILLFFALILISAISSFLFTLLPRILDITEHILHHKIPSFISFYASGALTFLILTTLVSAIYLGFTNKKMHIIEVLPGAILTIFLWNISTSILTYYVTNLSNFDVVYGSLAGVLIMLIFFYIINVILIYGATINYLFKRDHPALLSKLIKLFALQKSRKTK